jgi:uncharacterized protein (DUF1501 family)
MTIDFTRRHVLGLMGATATWLSCNGIAFAGAPTANRFVFVNLRGAMDGLAAVPPYFDPQYNAARGAISTQTDTAPGTACLPLDGKFMLHPALPQFQKMFLAQEALVVHAVASPCRERSHFNAQDILENGTDKAHSTQNGWLGRTLTQMAATNGLAIGQTIPLVLRGSDAVSSWSPSFLPEPDSDLLQRLSMMYQHDPVLARILNEAEAASSVADEAMGDDADMMAKLPKLGGKPRRSPGNNFPILAKAAGNFLAAPDGPRLAVLEIGGWDTHSNQGVFKGRLADNLKHLDNGMANLRTALGATWEKTIVVCMTEFGRAVAGNGTGGTDHGTGGAAFVLGGAITGGKVVTDWPGLGDHQLYENRDLRPTLDVRGVLKGILASHLGLDNAALDNKVFPDSGTIKPLQGIVRT